MASSTSNDYAQQQPQQQQSLPLSPTTPKAHYRHPLTRRSTTDSSASSTPSLSTSLASSVTTPTSTPINAATYQIRKKILSGPQSSHPDQILSTHRCLEEANNSVYAMRLAYETCDPCFFWYGDGHGSIHPDLIDVDPLTTVTSIPTTEKKGDCLSWEVFTDDDAPADSVDHEMGCRVWVERVETKNLWDVDEAIEDLTLNVDAGDKEQELSVGKKVLNWREALEPINRPCDFWGTFTVKSTGNFESRHASV